MKCVKLLGLAVSTAYFLVLAVSPTQAQTGYSITESTSPYTPPAGGQKPPNTKASGNWSTPAGDTAESIIVYYSTDGINWLGVDVPAANITGQGQTSGTYSVTFYLPKGHYYIYAKLYSPRWGVSKYLNPRV